MAPSAAGDCENSFPWLFLMYLASVRCRERAGGQEMEEGEPSTALAPGNYMEDAF